MSRVIVFFTAKPGFNWDSISASAVRPESPGLYTAPFNRSPGGLRWAYTRLGWTSWPVRLQVAPRPAIHFDLFR